MLFVSGLVSSNECATSCYRSSNRDPGAKAADALSPKDHEGVWLYLIPAIVFFSCFLLYLSVLMHPPEADRFHLMQFYHGKLDIIIADAQFVGASNLIHKLFIRLIYVNHWLGFDPVVLILKYEIWSFRKDLYVYIISPEKYSTRL